MPPLCRLPKKFRVAADDPLSPAELAFRKLLEPVKNPHSGHLEVSKEYSKLCAAARLRWEREHLVWFYGTNEKGGSTWGSKRPKPELEKLLRSRGQFRWMRRDVFLAELEAAKAKAQKSDSPASLPQLGVG
jgi:hypothetical protein